MLPASCFWNSIGVIGEEITMREGRVCLQDRCVDADKWKTNAWYNNYWVCRCFVNVVVLYLNLNLNVRFFLKMKCTDRWPQTIAMIRKTYRYRRNRILNLRHQITYTFFKILENFGRSSLVTAISTFFLMKVSHLFHAADSTGNYLRREVN